MRKVIGAITSAERDAGDSLGAKVRRARFEVAVAELPTLLRELTAELRLLRLVRERRVTQSRAGSTPSSRRAL